MIAKIIVPKASKIVFVSKFQRQQFLKNVKIPEFKCVTIPNAVDIDFYRPMNVHGLRDEIANGAEVVLLFVGRLTPHKGLHLLLKAIARLSPSYRKRIKLVVIGPKAPGFRPESRTSSKIDKYMLYISFLIRRYELNSMTRFLGQVNESKLPLYYNAADILVHPSLVEAFGLVVIEAMACGKPVLAFDIPPINEIVKPTVGVLAGLSIKDLCLKLEMLINDEKLRKKISLNARKYVLTRYSWDKIVQQYVKTYKRLVKH